MDYILRSYGEKHKLKDQELIHNADLFIVAGSETTVNVQLGVAYYLLKRLEAYRRVTEEVRSTFERAEEITFRKSTRDCHTCWLA
jgi:cytochrome P450